MKASRRTSSHRMGMALVYALCTMIAMLGLASFAVDYGRVRVARTQLQQAADAAAMYGITGLTSSISAAETRAMNAAADNKADGVTINITTANIEFGVWNPTTRVFSVLTGSARSSATAMRVTTSCTVPTVFAAALGRSSVNIQTSATATVGAVIAPTVNATACPWLAGMPNGSYVPRGSGNSQNTYAPAGSPAAVSSIPIVPGQKLSFRLDQGTTGWDDNSAGTFGPDGDTSWIVEQAACNGINSTEAPIGSLVGIFLDNRAPNTYSQATAGDFSTSTSRNYTTLSPPLKQVFFIGDGLNSSGVLQKITVPTGATRLYLGIMDEKGWWWDNTGSLSTTMMNSKVALVK